jgi:elongation factor G
VDLVHRRAFVIDKGTRTEIPIPAELEAEVATRREQLLEAAAEADDAVLTKYLEGEEVSDEELEACLRKGVRESVLAPVLLTSASREIGMTDLLDAVVRYLPSPAEGASVSAAGADGGSTQVPPDASGPLVAQVFKTAADPFVGRLSYFRVWSGSIRSHDHVWNPERGEEERIGQVLRLKGKDQESSPRARSARSRSSSTPSPGTRYRPGTDRSGCHGCCSRSRPCRWPSSPRPRPTWTSSARASRA